MFLAVCQFWGHLSKKCANDICGFPTNHSWAEQFIRKHVLGSRPHRLKKDSQYIQFEKSRSTSKVITWWDKRLYCRLKIWKFASIFFTDILDFVKIWMTSAGGNAPRKDVWRNMDCGMHLAWRATLRFQILCCHITRINRVPISVIDHGIDSGWLSQSFYSICERY